MSFEFLGAAVVGQLASALYGAVGRPVLEHLGPALLHVSVHEGVHGLRKMLRNPLKNADVARALDQSARLTLERLRDEYLKTVVIPARKKAANRIFDELLRQAHQKLAPDGSGDGYQEIDPAVLLREPSRASSLLVVSADASAPEDLVRMVNEKFPPLFASAFKEVGLKGDERVRAIIEHELLEGIREAQANGAARIEQSRVDILAALRTLEEQMRERTRAGPTRGVLFLLDRDHRCLLRRPLSDAAITIGRSEENPVQIPSKSVSGTHARIQVVGMGFDVRDLGSTNGTFLDEEKLQGTRRLRFGQEVRVGEFLIKVVGPDTPEALEGIAATEQDDQPEAGS